MTQSEKNDRNQDVFGAHKLRKKLLRSVGKAIGDFNMIDDGDRVMVCLSGGKDSYTLLDLLLKLQARAPITFSIVAVNLDQKQPGFPEHVLPEYLTALDVEYRIVERDTYSIVKEKTPEGKAYCSLCSKFRRSILYDAASELGATKVALGHHRDDLVHTLLLNLMFSGKLASMPPKLRSDDGRHIVIRPLAYAAEADIAEYAGQMAFPIIPCNLCGSQDNLQRQRVRELVQQWESQFPGMTEVMLNAIRNVNPSHLMDQSLFDFDQFSAVQKEKKPVNFESVVQFFPQKPQ